MSFWKEHWPRILVSASHKKLNYLGQIYFPYTPIYPILQYTPYSSIPHICSKYTLGFYNWKWRVFPWCLCTFLPVFDSLPPVRSKRYISLRNSFQEEQRLSPSVFFCAFPFFLCWLEISETHFASSKPRKRKKHSWEFWPKAAGKEERQFSCHRCPRQLHKEL